MDKQKDMEANKELEKIKAYIKKRKIKEQNKKLNEKHDFRRIDINEIRRRVYEKSKEQENNGVDAYSWFAKK